MKLLAIVGYPIRHSLSPAIYNAVFPAMGIEARYEAWETPPEALPGAIDRLRGRGMMGMNVTVPHKQAVRAVLDAVDPTAEAIGAVNCVAKDGERLIGHNTDKYGFVRSLREAGCNPAGTRALVLGVGGSARAVAYGLMEAGVASIALAGRTPERVEAAARDLRLTASRALPVATTGWHDGAFDKACAAADLIVNCTPIGMLHTGTEDESPLGLAQIRPGVWVADLVYTPVETALLRLAHKAGARPVAGLEMLVYQAAESVQLWTGRAPPIDIMRKACEKALALRNEEPAS